MASSLIEKFVNKFKSDGVDHIRISPFAETTIGKVASQDWRKKFFIPHVGEFLSPVCFANWLSTGDDDARHNPKFRCDAAVKGYRTFVMYAKFYQLCSMKSLLEKEMKDLPFVAYKVHQSGVKEFDRWKEYPAEVKEMIQHILDPQRGPKVAYPWEEKHAGLTDRIAERITAIAGVSEPEDSDRDDEAQPSDNPVEAVVNEQPAVETADA